MKRGITLLSIFLITILCLNIILSQEATANSETPPTSNQEPPDAAIINEDIKNLQEELKSTTSGFLEKEIEIPKNLEVPARIVFGLKPEDKLDFSLLIILIAIWAMFVIIFQTILTVTPFFEEWKSWIGAILVTTIVAATGAIKSVAAFWLELGGFFGVLEKMGSLKLFMSIILAALVIFLTKILVKIMKEKATIEEAVRSGTEAGAQIAKMKAMREIEEALKK